MLILAFVALSLIAIMLTAVSPRVRNSMIMTSLALLFLPFGLLVTGGWLVPRAVQLVVPYLPLKDAIS